MILLPPPGRSFFGPVDSVDDASSTAAVDDPEVEAAVDVLVDDDPHAARLNAIAAAAINAKIFFFIPSLLFLQLLFVPAASFLID